MLDDHAHDTKSLFAAIARLAGLWRERYRRQMAQLGYPWHLGAAGDLLDHLPPEGASQAALTASTGLTKQAVQQLLDQLEAHGVVRRDPDPSDKRARRIVPTQLGLRNLQARREVLAEIEQEARTALGRKAARRLRKSLRLLV